MAHCEEVFEKQINSSIRHLLNCMETGTAMAFQDLMRSRRYERHGSEQETWPPLPGKETRAEDSILGKGKDEGWQAWHLWHLACSLGQCQEMRMGSWLRLEDQDAWPQVNTTPSGSDCTSGSCPSGKVYWGQSCGRMPARSCRSSGEGEPRWGGGL